VESYVNAYVVEAVMEFFGMEDRRWHLRPLLQKDEDEKEWVCETIGLFVDEYVFPCWSGHDKSPVVLEGNILSFLQYLNI
jgi:hypothetical protein